VDADKVDEDAHKYKRDPALAAAFQDNPVLKMEFLRHLLDHYEHDNEFAMPDIIRDNSKLYLEENNEVFTFVEERLEYVQGQYCTLKQIRREFRDYTKGPTKLKTELEKLLDTTCLREKRINGIKENSVFMDWRLIPLDEYMFKGRETDLIDDETDDIDGPKL
jgi:hypothetical protein